MILKGPTEPAPPFPALCRGSSEDTPGRCHHPCSPPAHLLFPLAGATRTPCLWEACSDGGSSHITFFQGPVFPVLWALLGVLSLLCGSEHGSGRVGGRTPGGVESLPLRLTRAPSQGKTNPQAVSVGSQGQRHEYKAREQPDLGSGLRRPLCDLEQVT